MVTIQRIYDSSMSLHAIKVIIANIANNQSESQRYTSDMLMTLFLVKKMDNGQNSSS